MRKNNSWQWKCGCEYCGKNCEFRFSIIPNVFKGQRKNSSLTMKERAHLDLHYFCFCFVTRCKLFAKARMVWGIDVMWSFSFSTTDTFRGTSLHPFIQASGSAMSVTEACAWKAIFSKSFFTKKKHFFFSSPIVFIINYTHICAFFCQYDIGTMYFSAGTLPVRYAVGTIIIVLAGRIDPAWTKMRGQYAPGTLRIRICQKMGLSKNNQGTTRWQKFFDGKCFGMK